MLFILLILEALDNVCQSSYISVIFQMAATTDTSVINY